MNIGLFASGQSNWDGRGPKSSATNTFYLTDLKRTKIWDGNSLPLLSPGLDGVAGNHQYPGFISPSNSTNQVGPIVPITKYLEAKTKDNYYVFQYAFGGIPLTQGAGSTQSLGVLDPQANELFENTKREYKLFSKYVADNLEIPIKFEAAFWCQGEADWDYVNANRKEYKDAFVRWVTSVRELTGNPNLFIIIIMPVRLSTVSSDAAQNWVRYELAEFCIEDGNAAITTCQMTNFYGSSLSDFTTDLTHLDYETIIAEGKRAALIFNAYKTSDNAPIAVTSLSATPATTSVNLTWDDVGSREYIIMIDNDVSGFAIGNSVTISGLTSSTSYTAKVYSHNTKWDLAMSSVNFTTS